MSAQDLNITVVGPDDVPSLFKTAGLDMDGYFSDQPELAFAPHDGTSSGGYSTPITPLPGYLDLNMIDNHLSPTEHYDHSLSAPHSPFSPSNLSPAFTNLSLSESPFPAQHDFNSNYKGMQYPQADYTFSHQDPSGFNPSRAPLSVVIPAQPAADNSEISFMKDIFQFDDIDFNLPVLESIPAFMDETLPTGPDTGLQRVARNHLAHNRTMSWTPSTAHTSLTSPSPSLSFTPSDFPSSHLEVSTPYADDFVSGATVQRRHSHTGGRSTTRDERGRTDIRSGQASASSSRRSSPYPSPRPSHSPDTLSPNQIWESSNHLAVPSPIDSNSSLPRRHSFSTYPNSRSPSVGCDHLIAQSYQDDAANNTAVRKVASQAGIKASEARRTKEARFACDWCPQTFTTNHNLKNHRNVHLGVKDHPCERCTRQFTTQSVLARHRKTCKAHAS